MVQLNFGKSEFWSYGTVSMDDLRSAPDMIINIPDSGPIEPFPDEALLAPGKDNASVDVLVPGGSQQSFMSVEFPLETDWPTRFEREKRVVMPWIAERGEWVAIVYHKWLELSPRNDESFSGPYTPNEYCQRKIMEAYRIPHLRINLSNVVRTTPDELKRIGRDAQGLFYSVLFEEDDDVLAVDWNSQEGRWHVSARENTGTLHWSFEGPVDQHRYRQKAYDALLSIFELPPVYGDLSRMSPRQLFEAGTNDPYSSTLGDLRRASEVA